MSENSDLAAEAKFIKKLATQIKNDFETLEDNVRNLPAAWSPNTHQASLESLIRQRDHCFQDADRLGQLLMDTAAFHLSLDRLRSRVDHFVDDTGAYSLNATRRQIYFRTLYWRDACKQTSWHLCQQSRKLRQHIDILNKKIGVENNENAYWGI